ncbi:MAG: Crp/Fnr family transcriptional regulator [Gemmatimonadales bacterium]
MQHCIEGSREIDDPRHSLRPTDPLTSESPGRFGELLLSVLGMGQGSGDALAPRRLSDHSQCVVVSELFRGKLCEELGRRPARRIEAGEFLYHMGEAARSVYLVRGGLIKTSVVSPGGQELTLRVHKPGEILGELCLCLGERRDQAVALEKSEVVEIPLDLLIARLRQDPHAALDFASTACAHLVLAYERLRSLSVEPVLGRLTRTLLDLASDLGETTPQGIRIPHHITQEELARLISARREVVSGLLNQLRNAGLISYTRRGLIVLNRRALQDLLDSIGRA